MMQSFGSFRLDTLNQCLWRDGDRVSLTPKAFDVMRHLIDRAGRLVSQDELLEALWPETYVNPEGIRKYILEIRKVLGDPPDRPVYIETLRKRGYRFIAPVKEEGEPSRPERVPEASVSIVGRQAAIAELHQYFLDAAGGRRRVVFVTGEAGIGKTTLVDTFQQLLGQAGVRIARGQCIEGFGGLEAYYPVLEAVGSLLRQADGRALIGIFAERAPTWLIQFPALVKPEQRESLRHEIQGSTRERMVREICEVLEAITAQAPLAMILEDLHWVDPATLDLLSAIARRREAAKLILIGTYRPVDVILSQSPLKGLKQDLSMRQLCREIAIELLEEADVADFLKQVFSVQRLPEGLAALIHCHSGGNPLFMTAMIEDLANKGLIAESRGGLLLTAPLEKVHPGIPDTLHQLLEVQLEQLTAGQRRILDGASVAGEHFSVWAVAAMLGMDPLAIEEECDTLAGRRQFLRASGVHRAPDGVPSACYEFRHSLYRQALYRGLPAMSRSKFHLQLGERLMPLCAGGRTELAAELGVHFEEGLDYERAAHCWMLAAENALKRFSYGDSIQLLRRALELAEALPAHARGNLRMDILRRTGDAHYALGEMSNSAAAYEAEAKAAADAGLQPARMAALLRLSFPAWFLDQNRGRDVCRQVLEAAESVDDPLLTAQTRLAVASFRLIYDGWRAQDAQLCASARDTIRSLHGVRSAQNVFSIHVQALEGDYEDAYRQAETMMHDTANPTASVLATGAMGLILMARGRFGEVVRIIRRGTEWAARNGQDPWMSIIGDVWLRHLCFDFEGVQRVSSAAARSDTERHAALTRTIARMSAGYAELYIGNYNAALECFGRVLEAGATSRFFLHWYWSMEAQAGVAEARLSAGDVEAAKRGADAFLQSALSAAEPNLQARAWEIRARTAAAEKDREGAGACIENAAAILKRFDIPMTAWQVHRTAADLHACAGEADQAGAHRARAKELIWSIAGSLEPGETGRESLLAAPPVRRLLEQARTEGLQTPQPESGAAGEFLRQFCSV